MTTTRYYLHRLAKALGLQRRNQRMGEAAAETHLLREAEVYLGSVIWEKTESIEQLTTDYWNLRKLAQEHEAIAEKIADCQERLQKAHEERAALLNVSSEPEVALSEEKAALVTKQNQLAIRRDEIIIAAKEIRRHYDGIKTKSEVLAKQGTDPKSQPVDMDGLQASLTQLKGRFTDLKKERDEIGAEIDAGDLRIDELNDKLKEIKKGHYELASKAFQAIGDLNKDISGFRAEIGVIDTRMAQLHGVIGRHVSRSVPGESSCVQASKGQQGLIDVMRALRKSITLNHKLADLR